MANLRAPSTLADHVLIGRLEVLVRDGRRLDAEILRMIGEVDRRRLYRDHACSSMFAFCVQRLGMSEDVAFKRIRVARAARALPLMLEYLESGRIHLSGLSVLAAHLKVENAKAVLERAAGKSKRQIEVLARELAPLPDVALSIRKTSTIARPAAATSCPPTSSSLAPAPVAGAEPAASLAPPKKLARIAPLSPATFHVSFTGSAEFKKNIDKATELAGFGATVEPLFEQAMELLVDKLSKKRLGVAGRKAPKKNAMASRGAPARSRYIAKAVKREVFERDGGRCTYVDELGRRCSERHGLHFDHIVPHARGGKSTPENLRLRCGPHDQLHAEDCYGALFMARRRGAPSLAKSNISSDP